MLDTPPQPDAPLPDATRRQPGQPIETDPRLPQILAAIKRGDSMRTIADRYDLAVSSVHRLSRKLAGQTAERAGLPPPPPPTPRPAPVDLPTVLAEHGCPICSWAAVQRSHVDRALFGTPAPDLQRIAAAFKVDAGALHQHWSHTPRPRWIDPEPPPAPPPWRPKPPPAPLPADLAAAEALVHDRGPRIVNDVTRWARTEFLCFCDRWHGPSRAKTHPWKDYEAVARQGNPAATLLAVTTLIHALVNLAAQDGSVLLAAEEHARLTSHAQPAQSFNAQRFLSLLGQRGVTFRVDEKGAIVASNAGALNSMDRELLARYRNDISAQLMQTETFVAAHPGGRPVESIVN